MPILNRKEILAETLPNNRSLIGPVPYTIGQGRAYFDLCKQHNLEGIVQKRINSTYHIGHRVDDWVKILNMAETDVFITGYRKARFGWLLAYPDGRPAGILELAVPPSAKRILRSLEGKLRTGESDKYVYYAPVLRCRVKYKNFTKVGFLRQPVFEELLLD